MLRRIKPDDFIEINNLIQDLHMYFNANFQEWWFNRRGTVSLEDRIAFFDKVELRLLVLVDKVRELKKKYTEDISEEDY